MLTHYGDVRGRACIYGGQLPTDLDGMSPLFRQLMDMCFLLNPAERPDFARILVHLTASSLQSFAELPGTTSRRAHHPAVAAPQPWRPGGHG